MAGRKALKTDAATKAATEGVTKSELKRQAKVLHDKLHTYGVKPHKIPTAVIMLRDLHRKIIAAEYLEILEESLGDAYDFGGASSDDMKLMRTILNKLTHYSSLDLTDEEFDVLERANHDAVTSVLDYLFFQEKVAHYIATIKDYLRRLKNFINNTVIQVDNEHGILMLPVGFKRDPWLVGIYDMRKLLKDIERERLPLRILAIYEKITALVYGMEAKMDSMPAIYASFYHSRLQEIRRFGFLQQPLEEKKEIAFYPEARKKVPGKA